MVYNPLILTIDPNFLGHPSHGRFIIVEGECLRSSGAAVCLGQFVAWICDFGHDVDRKE